MSKYSYSFDNNNNLYFNIIDGKLSHWYYGTEYEPFDQNISKVNVFYNYYKSQKEERYKEILYCFDKLLKNKFVDNLYVLCSDELFIENDKIVKINLSKQPKFYDIFNLIKFFSKDNDINIIINSDCYIDEENIRIIKKHLKNNEAYLLSRWDILKIDPLKVQHFNIVNRNDSGVSQDAWIFKGKPKKDLIGDYEMGRAGCDNAIAYEFDKSGYSISNPSFTIKIYHYHLSKIRTYGDYEVDGIDNREEYRIPPPYKMVPSSKLFDDIKIVFFNHYHNGDIHYSKEFIKDIIKKYKAISYSYYFDLEHVCDKNIIGDVNITHTNKLPNEINHNSQLVLKNDTLYINTWVGQKDYYYVDNFGINLDANYEIYKEIYNKLNIRLENKEFYIPTIDFERYKTASIDEFLENKKKNIKVLISNGITRSAQSNNFDFNETINILSSIYEDVIFILTDSSNRLKKNNIFYTSDIINKKCDLNEISYLSNFCDIIVGRASGPYAFAQTKRNLFDVNKTFICFCDEPKTEWYISKSSKHIISNDYSKKNIIDTIMKEIDLKIENKSKNKIGKTVDRIAFTIILNGIHHLTHNKYAEFLAETFDYWVIVEGASRSKGSTSWCKKMPDEYHKNGKSIDGTVEFIKELQKKYKNIILIESNGMWNSKDDMVNKAILEIKKITNSCFLWQIDIDEQWTIEQIINSEIELLDKGGKVGKFEVYQFVGEDLISVGKDWAGIPFKRLWDWNGEKFISHEPPVLQGEKEQSVVLLSNKMKHYSFYFEQDVKFKNDWYSDHEGLYKNWLKLKEEDTFPQHITYLLPQFKNSKNLRNSQNLDSYIVRYSSIENIDLQNISKENNEIYKFDNKEEDINKTNEITISLQEIDDKNSSQFYEFDKKSKLNEFVNRVYVINLERRKDRLEHTIKEFKKINVSFERINAIDGKLLDIQENDVRKSQIGCLRSHISVIKDALKNGYNKIAIFEDDNIFCEDFEERLNYYIKNIPTDWDIMYLGCNLDSSIEPRKVKNFIFKVFNCYGCFAMILNNKDGLFQKIIDITKEESKPIDNYYYDHIIRFSKAYVFMPFFVKSLNNLSDICSNPKPFSYEKYVDSYFKERVNLNLSDIQPAVVNKPPVEDYPKSTKDVCEDYLKSRFPFQIFFNGRVIFDSSTSDKINVAFFDTYFTVYGRPFSYQGMSIRNK